MRPSVGSASADRPGAPIVRQCRFRRRPPAGSTRSWRAPSPPARPPRWWSASCGTARSSTWPRPATARHPTPTCSHGSDRSPRRSPPRSSWVCATTAGWPSTSRSRRTCPVSPVGALTPRQLLGHVSGLRREPDGAWWERHRRRRHRRAARRGRRRTRPYIHRCARTTTPTSGTACSAPSSAAITGDSWYDAVAARLLDPLGMHRTTYHADDPFLPGYVVHPFDGTLREEPRPDAGAMAPAGQLWSTVGDLSRWAAFLADPVPAVLAPGRSRRCAYRWRSATWSRGPAATVSACETVAVRRAGLRRATSVRCRATWRC